MRHTDTAQTGIQQYGPLPLEAQVEAALRQDHGSGARLVSWIAETFTAQGDHYLDVVRLLRVTYNNEGIDGHTSCVAKIKPSSSLRKEFIDVAHKKECLVHDTLVPMLNGVLLQTADHEALRLPRCFFCSIENGRKLIIL